MAKTTSNRTKNADSTSKKSLAGAAQGNHETARGVIGIIVLIFSVYLLLAFASYLFTGAADQSVLDNSTLEEITSTDNGARNSAGAQGAMLAGTIMNGWFGVSSVFIVVFLISVGLRLMKIRQVNLVRMFLKCGFLMVWLSIFLGFTCYPLYKDSFFYWGGLHGYNVSTWMASQIGSIGLWLLLALTMLVFLIIVSRKTLPLIRDFFTFKFLRKGSDMENKGDVPGEFTDSWSKPKREEPKPERQVVEETPSPEVIFDEEPVTSEPQSAFDTKEPEPLDVPLTIDTYEEEPVSQNLEDAPFEDERHDSTDSKQEDNPEVKEPLFTVEALEGEDSELVDQEPYNPRLDLENYKLPPLSLLKQYDNEEPTVDMGEQQANKHRIVETLKNFGIDISSIKATVGPTVTLYEITPAAGVRISKIRGLEDDIALSLSALGIRIIAPIPGKGTIGIEVPNNSPRMVSGQSILGSKKFQESDYELPLAIGKTISNEVFMVDLCKMPHVLVAGATGQGKSVGLNAMIMSLLYKKHPSELKLVMVDPKKVEFSIYSCIEHHFLAELPEATEPIVTDDKKVVRTLTSVCQEMDDRYDLLKMANVRNIKEYNAKFISRHLNPNNGHRFLPYIVVIIDEFGDLIMTAGKDIELPIARIAQKARAVGIHMIIATQRPTTNIITGTIKANFPARVAFRVASMIDSRTILDRPGANQLIGRGDMLFTLGNDPVRVQCAFIDTPEVVEITDFISHQQGYVTPFYLPEPQDDGDGEGGSGADVDMSKLDSLFEEAARLIVIHQQGSTSLIQRKFSIGYNRAGRLMDQLEKAGIVGPAMGSKPRDVYCVDEMDLEGKLQNLKR